MADHEPPKELDQEQLNEVIQQLQTDEQSSIESTLDSVESFQVWAGTHPAMRQMFVVEKFSDIGPVILRFLRALFGLDRGSALSETEDDPVTEQPSGGDRRA